MAIDIRDATQTDFDEIHFWLKTEEVAWKALGDDRWEADRGFFCNIGVIKDSFDDRKMRVLRDDGRLIGFMSYGLTRNGVMEVKAEERGKGYGRTMVQDALRQARDEGRNALYIECAPKTSKPFWKSMGFRMYRTPGMMDHQYASMLLHRTIDLPPGGQDRDVLIQMFPQEAKWHDDTSAPVMQWRLVGKVYGDRPEIYLPERVVFDVDRLVPLNCDDAMVRILVDGEKVYFTKSNTRKRAWSRTNSMFATSMSSAPKLSKAIKRRPHQHATSHRMAIRMASWTRCCVRSRTRSELISTAPLVPKCERQLAA